MINKRNGRISNIAGSNLSADVPLFWKYTLRYRARALRNRVQVPDRAIKRIIHMKKRL